MVKIQITGIFRQSSSLFPIALIRGCNLLNRTILPPNSHASILNKNKNHQNSALQDPSESRGQTSFPKYAASAIWQNSPTSTTPVNILI